MSSASSPRAHRAAEPEIARLADDPLDEDANAAPTKVGPMSKAFVDQMMFKAQLAESQPPSRPQVSEPPTSGESGRAARAATPAGPPPSSIVVVNAGDDALPFEPTQPAADAAPPPAPPVPAGGGKGHTTRLRPAPTAAPFAAPAFASLDGAPVADSARSSARRRKSAQRIALEVAVLASGLALMITALALWLLR